MAPREARVARTANADGEQTVSQPIMALPQPLLEQILVTNTCQVDKMILRQTCKWFYHTVDRRLMATSFQCDECQKMDCLTEFLQRLQHSQCFQTLMIDAYSFPPFSVDKLLPHLPTYLTTLLIDGEVSSLKPLQSLQRLTTLSLHQQVSRSSSLADITGLTRLECCTLVGSFSLAHLAPTLKQLSMKTLSDVEGLGCLTNLKILEVRDELAGDFFATYSHLPLETLCFQGIVDPDNDCIPMKSGFVKLTRLTLHDDTTILPELLPESITWLQLLNACEEDFEEIAAALPKLRAFDLCLRCDLDFPWGKDFAHLSRLTNLRRLGLRIEDYECRPYYSEEYWSPDYEHASDFEEEGEEERGGEGQGEEKEGEEEKETEDCYVTRGNMQGGGNRGRYRRPPRILSREEILAELPHVLKIVGNGVLLNVVESSDEFLGVLRRLRVDQTLWDTSV